MKNGKILVVDDNSGVLTALSLLLRSNFEYVDTISNPNLILSKLTTINFDIILLDMNFKTGINNGNEGLYWLKQIKSFNDTIQVIMITAYGDVSLAVEALKAGATDFVLKPWDNEKLLATIFSAIKLRYSILEVKVLKKRETLLKHELQSVVTPFIGQSKAIIEILDLVEKVAPTDANILITGENGTGKEVLARFIHSKSNRSDQIMVSTDIASVSEHLFESELFGHVKGAFTDAIQDRIGKFQLADKGTMFLDEIGNIPLALQSKLLTVLQNRLLSPVGSDKVIPVDIRLISATNCNLPKMVTEKRFREDLLYRLNTIHIDLPPLRNRSDDIELIALHFLKIYEKKYMKSGLKLSQRAINKLRKYTWPGNVRELQHSVEKAVILTTNEVLTPEDFSISDSTYLVSNEFESLESAEKRLIKNALMQFGDNLSMVAKQLGITRQTLYNKLKKYDL